MNSFNGLNVLITGADGFIASHLCEYLYSKKAKVTALLRRNSGGIFKNLNDIKNKLIIKWGDTQDLALMMEVTRDKDIVYHLAAQSHVGHSLYNPCETIINDVISTLNILEAARKNDNKRIIHAGSSEIYGDPKYVPIDEKHPLHPKSPYAAAKASSENLLESFYHTYGLPVVKSRFFNIYGPRQGLDQVIPKFILQSLNNKKISIYGDGTQTRDYTYVDDAVKGYGILGIKKNLEGKTINFGSEKEIKIKDLANLIIKLTKSKSTLQFSKELRSGEISRLLCNSKMAKEILGWEAKTDLTTGLIKTIEFFKKRKNLISNLPYML